MFCPWDISCWDVCFRCFYLLRHILSWDVFPLEHLSQDVLSEEVFSLVGHVVWGHLVWVPQTLVLIPVTWYCINFALVRTISLVSFKVSGRNGDSGLNMAPTVRLRSRLAAVLLLLLPRRSLPASPLPTPFQRFRMGVGTGNSARVPMWPSWATVFSSTSRLRWSSCSWLASTLVATANSIFRDSGIRFRMLTSCTKYIYIHMCI